MTRRPWWLLMLAGFLVSSSGCCRWCDRWCHNNPAPVAYAPQQQCVPCYPQQPAPVCCPASPAPATTFQRNPYGCP